MRRYDDTIDVRLTQVTDEHGGTAPGSTPTVSTVSTVSTGSAVQPMAQPSAFVWRGRLYLVRAVQTRWFERRAWWREAAAATLLGLRGDEQHGQPSDGQPSAAAGAAEVPGGGGYLDGETEVWRVEAAAGRSGPVGVFDLARPVPTMPATAMPATAMPATAMPATAMPATAMPATAMPGAAPTGWRLTRVAD